MEKSSDMVAARQMFFQRFQILITSRWGFIVVKYRMSTTSHPLGWRWSTIPTKVILDLGGFIDEDLKDFKFTTVVFLRRLPFFQEKLVQGTFEHADVSLDNAILPMCLSGAHGNLDRVIRTILEEFVSLEATFRVDMKSAGISHECSPLW
jgi:hypothetical protein